MSYKIAGELVGWFSLLYAFAFGLFALMQRHIIKKADLLFLSPFELAETKSMYVARWGQFIIALGTSGLAFFTVLGPAAGALHALFGFAYWFGNRRYPSKHLKNEIHSES